MGFSGLAGRLRSSNPNTPSAGHTHAGGCCGGHLHDHDRAHSEGVADVPPGGQAHADEGCDRHGHDRSEPSNEAKERFTPEAPV